MARKVVVKYNGLMMFQRELPEYIQELKKMRKRIRAKKNIKRHIELKKLNLYVTITLDQNKKNRYKNQHQALQKILKRNNVDYYLIPELHSDGAYHYHGFLGNAKIRYKGFKNKFKKNVYTVPLLQKNYGNIIAYLLPEPGTWQYSRIISYVSKYVTKDGYSRALANRIAPILDEKSNLE